MAELWEALPCCLGLREGNLLLADCAGRSSWGFLTLRVAGAIIPALGWGNSTIPGTAEPQKELSGCLGLREGNLLLKQERDERTGEFLQTMLNGNLGEASEALKKPNFDLSDGPMEHSWTGCLMELGTSFPSSGDGNLGSTCVKSYDSFTLSGGCAPIFLSTFLRPRGNSTIPGTAEPRKELPGCLRLREGNLLRVEGAE